MELRRHCGFRYDLRPWQVTATDWRGTNVRGVGGFAAAVACIYFAAWRFRQKYEVDYLLDGFGRIVRWAVVAIGFAVANIPGPNTGLVRLCGFNIGLLFLCWPNCAYHLRNFIRPEGRYNGDKGRE
jgi:hypothetical protein